MYIYFIQSEIGGPIKIGITVHPRKRLKEMQAVNPFELRFVALQRGTFFEEKQYHKQFANQRLHGEWFGPSQKLSDLVKKIGVCRISGIKQPVPASQQAVKMLTMREEGKSLKEIGEQCQVSRQRVHQILKNNT